MGKLNKAILSPVIKDQESTLFNVAGHNFKMTGENIIVEKAGKTLRAEYFKTNNGSGIRCFINEEFIQEEIYEGKSIAWAESAATNWTTGVKKLNG